MKKILMICLFVLVLLPGIACKKDKTPATFAAPDWVLVKKELHPYSMTAVVQIDEKISAAINANDQLGAFVGNECRGKGILVNNNGKTVFYLQIHGSAAEQNPVYFQYYQAGTGYMYAAVQPITFVVDDNIGTVDNPVVPELRQMN